MQFSICLTIACILVFVSFLACLSTPDEPRLGDGGRLDPRYNNWETTTFANIRIKYPAGHLHADGMADLARGYPGAIIRDCRMLEIPVPTETLTVIYYTGLGQGEEWTGHDYPFVVDSTIYFWLPSFLGPTIAHYLLPKWVDSEPRYQFLRHGLISLLDESRQNYHEFTGSYLDTAGFMPLVELAVDTTIDSNRERLQSGMAASFVDFILYTYGQPLLKALYKADEPIEFAVPELLDISVDSLQAEWLNLVKIVSSGGMPPRKPTPWTQPVAESENGSR